MAVDPANPTPPTYPRYVGMDQVPAHVDPALIRSNGITFSPEFLANPQKMFQDLHDTSPPLYYDVSMMGNSWQAIKHEDALFILRHPEIFSNEGATPFPRDPDDYFYFIPQEIDPPNHRKYRNIVDPVVSPQGVMKLEGKIRALANDLIDQFIDDGAVEFTEAFGRPLPVMVFLDLMGLPQAMRDTFVEWAMELLHSNDRGRMGAAMQSITDYLKSAIAEKKANPDDGMVSRIAHGEVDGRPLTHKEVFGFVCFLFIAGLDTVFATLNNIWGYLAANPQIVQQMRDDPDNINAQVEELLRVWSVTFSGRVLIQDYELRGVKLKKDDRITCVLPACNFDPEVFTNPREVRFDRPRQTVLAFTVGAHSCMGAHLARLEVKIALQEWLRRIPHFSMKPDTVLEYRPGGVVGPEEVPLVW